MARKVTRDIMGLLNNNKNTNKRNTIQVGLRYREVIAIKVELSSLRWAHYDESSNNDELRLSLDCLSEVRDEVAQRMAQYQQKMTKYHNQRVKLKRFNPDDMVLQKASQAIKTQPKKS